jgi:hypothetical protein
VVVNKTLEKRNVFLATTIKASTLSEPFLNLFSVRSPCGKRTDHDPGSREWLDQVKEDIINPKRKIVYEKDMMFSGTATRVYSL